MTIVWKRTKKERIEVMLWQAGTGPITLAVKDATMRFGLTFGAALITRPTSGSYKNN